MFLIREKIKLKNSPKGFLKAPKENLTRFFWAFFFCKKKREWFFRKTGGGWQNKPPLGKKRVKDLIPFFFESCQMKKKGPPRKKVF